MHSRPPAKADAQVQAHARARAHASVRALQPSRGTGALLRRTVCRVGSCGLHAPGRRQGGSRFLAVHVGVHPSAWPLAPLQKFVKPRTPTRRLPRPPAHASARLYDFFLLFPAPRLEPARARDLRRQRSRRVAAMDARAESGPFSLRKTAFGSAASALSNRPTRSLQRALPTARS